ncbi:MAG TPA: GIDE domain-containing protein [Candidatus Norongarragalinales archaeon]|nr:GIDE domain-containing protein [Candidatus Norongarragalinales archaeon]
MNIILLIFGLIFGGAGYFVIKKAKDEENALYRISRLPPVQLEDAVDGVPSKCYGRIICDKPYPSPYTGTPCVWSRSVKERYVETRDSKGRRSGRWETVEDVRRSVIFDLDDGTGKIGINLEGVPLDFIDAKKVLDEPGMHMNGATRREEHVIMPENAFVYGMAIRSGNHLMVCKDAREPLAISYGKEEEFLKRKRSDDKWVNLAGYSMAIIGGAMLLFGIIW